MVRILIIHNKSRNLRMVVRDQVQVEVLCSTSMRGEKSRSET